MAAEGITKRHSKGCPAQQDGRCRCKAGWEAWVFDKKKGKKIRKGGFASEGAAKAWRRESLAAQAKGALSAPNATKLEQAWDAWLAGARRGVITNRSGKPYKPSALRSYDQAMRLRVLPHFGEHRLSDIHRPDLQAFVNELVADGLNASTVQVTLLPIRAVYRHSLSLGKLAINPCADLELPAVRGRRERFASPQEAADLLVAITKPRDRVIWATAFYAGLRRGELRALRREDVDLAAGVLHVRRGWDPVEGQIDLKSEAGRRRVPIAAILRDYLIDRLAERRGEPHERIFGERKGQAFSADKLQMRADEAWSTAGLARITLHECRHTFASLMIAAMSRSEQGFNPKALSTYMGHANISITLDRYGHLMPGSEAESAALLDSYLSASTARIEDAARAAGGVLAGA